MVTVTGLAQADSRHLAIALFILLGFAPLAVIPVYADNDNDDNNDNDNDNDHKNNDKHDKDKDKGKEKDKDKDNRDNRDNRDNQDNDDNDNDDHQNDNDNNDNDNDNNDNDNEGCTPGFWKNHQNSWPDGFYPDDSFEDVFGVDLTGDLDDLTLSEALNLRGGGLKALIRHATGGILNAAHSGVNYDFAVAEVMEMFQDAFASGNYEHVTNMLEDENEQGCPLNGNEDDNDLVAVPDAASTDEDTPVTINVLANDIIDDDDYDFITISSVSNPARGIASIIGTNVQYTPNPDFFGIDTFTYTMTDGHGTSTATVTLTIDAVNDAPVADDDSYNVDEDD
ncbi:MAG: cadherin-like domain-containing protein, partial [Nitrososphaerales archaeon]